MFKSRQILPPAMMNRYLPVALLAFLVMVIPMAAQDTTSIPASDTLADQHVKLGFKFRSVQADVIFLGSVAKSVSADLDFLEIPSRPPFGIGIRGGVEWEESGSGILDYGFERTSFNIFTRMSVLSRWVRLDLYGGYTHISMTEGGFVMPGEPPERHRSYHTLKLGGELRIYVVPRILALLIKYSGALDKPFADDRTRARDFTTGGIGALIGWQW